MAWTWKDRVSKIKTKNMLKFTKTLFQWVTVDGEQQKRMVTERKGKRVLLYLIMGLPHSSPVKTPLQCRRCRDFSSRSGRSPGGTAWQLDTVVLPGKFHAQWSTGRYSPWDRKASDTTERTERAGMHTWSCDVKSDTKLNTQTPFCCPVPIKEIYLQPGKARTNALGRKWSLS